MKQSLKKKSEKKSTWSDLFQGQRGIHTILLNVGIGIHAIDIFVITTVMPMVVSEIGGIEFYAWTTMLYMVGTVIGAASGRFARSSLGRRESYAGSGLIFLIGAFGCSVAPNMGVLLFFRAIEGIGGGLLMSQSMTLVNDLYIGKLRTRILATITTTWSIAAVIGPLMGGLWGTLGSWRGAFATTSLLAMFFVIAAWRIVPQNKEAEKQELPFLRLSLLGISICCMPVVH